jgi:hypothetical protein
MGLFDLFASKQERESNALRRFSRRVTERYGPPENRQKAIQQLADSGTPDALRVLCLRFTVQSDPGITDGEEKETVRQILVDAGQDAVAPVKDFLEQQESGISWGLRVLAELLSADEVTAVVLALLTRLGREYTRDPEKKLVLLTWLAEHHTAAPGGRAEESGHPSASIAQSIESALLPLLEDFSDDVRITATRVLARQPITETSRVPLIELLLRDRDNARVRGAVLQALCDLGADVKGYRPSVETLLVEPFFLDKEGRVKKRGV